MSKPTTLDEMTREEKSLLLFFETAAVDYGGRLDTAHMNAADLAIGPAGMKRVSYGSGELPRRGPINRKKNIGAD